MIRRVGRPVLDPWKPLDCCENSLQDAEDCLTILALLMDELIPSAFKYFSGEKTFDIEFDNDSEASEASDGDDDDEADADADAYAGDTNRDRAQKTKSVNVGEGQPKTEQDCKQQ